MQYTVKKLAEIAGVSVRTLRYYDEIGLLSPCRINSSGYRIYTQKEIDLLQQILFYKSMDMKLEEIQKLLTNTNFDINTALLDHYNKLILKRDHINKLILTVEKTLQYNKGELIMTNKEKFEVFKKESLDKNEINYGEEIRDKYGSEAIEESNRKWMNMSQDDFEKMQRVETEMFKALNILAETKDLDSYEAKYIYEKHKEWLSFTWPAYTLEAHIGLAGMYIADERFAKYYNDKAGEESAQLLHDAIVKYAK